MLGTRLINNHVTKYMKNNILKVCFSAKAKEHMTLYHNKIDAERTEYRVVDPSARKVCKI